jgi:Gas vesicle synthesis protein GvpL/GvpF
MTTTQQMSAVFVYAVVPEAFELPEGLTGVDGASVDVVKYGEVAAVVCPMMADRPTGRRADLTAYSSVIDALAAEGTVAPLRFGTVVAGHDVLIDELLAPRVEELAQQLRELEGMTQYHLRATYVEETVLTEITQADARVRGLRDATRDLPEEASLGDRVRLGELVTRSWERWAQADADRILAELDAMVTAYRVRREPGLSAVLDVALLVDVHRAQELEDRLEAMAAEAHARLRFRLAGPMAAYDFVGSS